MTAAPVWNAEQRREVASATPPPAPGGTKVLLMVQMPGRV